jgi:hypothetical protein
MRRGWRIRRLDTVDHDPRHTWRRGAEPGRPDRRIPQDPGPKRTGRVALNHQPGKRLFDSRYAVIAAISQRRLLALLDADPDRRRLRTVRDGISGILDQTRHHLFAGAIDLDRPAREGYEPNHTSFRHHQVGNPRTRRWPLRMLTVVSGDDVRVAARL